MRVDVRRPECLGRAPGRVFSRRGGFTLVEALVSLTVTVTLGAALLLAAETSANTTSDSVDQTIAAGLAEQILDEVSGARYCAPGSNPRQWPMGPNASEGPHRDNYNDIDDFVGEVSQPPVDPWDVAVGQEDTLGRLRHASFRLRSGYFSAWSTRIDVFYVSSADFSVALAAGQTSYHRAVRVRVFKNYGNGVTRTLADVKRVFSYVPEI
ncbi:MAG: prepilin-type N-terminal cleavage/methylation domain-containing protein [Planctomycetia bacterium]|nr:prepilin-type N-terminal cleavage/methylation domain-containing protein [Planctomycetia bacterium]